MNSMEISEIVEYITQNENTSSKNSLDLNNDNYVNIHDIITLIQYKSLPKIENIEDINVTSMPQIEIDLNNGLYFIHVDWCYWCNVAKPEIIKLKNEFPNKIIMYNVTANTLENRKIKTDFKLTHYPFIVIVKDNLKYKYRGQRNFEQLSYYLNKYNI